MKLKSILRLGLTLAIVCVIMASAAVTSSAGFFFNEGADTFFAVEVDGGEVDEYSVFVEQINTFNFRLGSTWSLLSFSTGNGPFKNIVIDETVPQAGPEIRLAGGARTLDKINVKVCEVTKEIYVNLAAKTMLWWFSPQNVDILISGVKVKHLEVSSSGRVFVRYDKSCDADTEFNLKFNGKVTGEFIFPETIPVPVVKPAEPTPIIQVKKFTADIKNDSILYLYGTAEEVDYTVGGTSKIYAYDFPARIATINTSGNSKVEQYFQRVLCCNACVCWPRPYEIVDNKKELVPIACNCACGCEGNCLDPKSEIPLTGDPSRLYATAGGYSEIWYNWLRYDAYEDPTYEEPLTAPVIQKYLLEYGRLREKFEIWK